MKRNKRTPATILLLMVAIAAALAGCGRNQSDPGAGENSKLLRSGSCVVVEVRETDRTGIPVQGQLVADYANEIATMLK